MNKFHIKIMVNWADNKIVHTSDHAGSEEYQALVLRGYTKVGTIKVERPTKIFWEDPYFNPKDKYIK